MARYLGIDIGTSGTKAVLVDENGLVQKSAHASYPMSVPKPGWAEQNPQDWWDAVQSCLTEVGGRPDAIGLTGQMHGSVFLDADDQVIRPALLWCDQRTQAECLEIDEFLGRETVKRITGNPPLTGFQLPKILWLRKNEPDNFRRLDKVLLPKDYVRLKLTGDFATDVSDASGVGAYDVHERKLSQDIVRGLGLDVRLFPPSFESYNPTGVTEDGVIVVAGAGDQAAGAVGVGAVEPGVVSLSLGTSGVAFATIEKPGASTSESVHTFCHANGGWHAMGVMLSCGGALSWMRDTFCPEFSFEQLGDMAASAPVGCDGLTFLPYLSGERCPIVDPDARGSFAGLALSHDRSAIVRAVFEGVTFGLSDCLDAVAENGGSAGELRITGGGANSPFWVQMVADVTGKVCVTMKVDEGPAFGAAILAGVAAGEWPNVVMACEKVVKIKRRYFPAETSFVPHKNRYKTLYPLLKDWAAMQNTIK